MSGSGGQSGDRDIWAGSLTIGLVGAVVVWTLRLLVSWEVHPSLGTKCSLLLLALTLLGVLCTRLRTWAVVGTAVPLMAAFAGFTVTDARSRPGLVIATIGAYAGVSLLVSYQWSNRLMRVTGGVLAVAALLLTVRSGRAELDDQRLRQARATAVSLAGELDDPSASAETEAAAAIEALCEAANGSLSLAPPPPTCLPKDQSDPAPPEPLCPPEVKPDDPRCLSLLAAQAKRQVAAAKVAHDRTDAHVKGLADANSALASVQAEQGAPAPSHDLTTVVTAGAERLARSVPGIGGDRIPLGLGSLGWGLLGGLAILGCRWLEIVSRDRSRGLVKINESEIPTKDADFDTAFRRHVLSNVHEPGPIPGGATPASVTDLLGAADPTALVKKVVAAISAVTAVTPGFELDATYQRQETAPTIPPEGDAGGLSAEPVGQERRPECHQVFVRVRKARTGATLKTHLVTAPTAGLAARSAGYWAASYILGRDSTAPSWVHWPEGSAEALAEYDEAVQDANDNAESKLRQALALGPASGLLLATLANALELSGGSVEALELHIRAATHHPRYPHARYRLAMSLSNLAASNETWARTPLPDKRRISQALGACAGACGVDIEPLPDEPALGDLLVAAEEFRRATRSMFRPHRVAVYALRRSERRYWAPMLFDSDQRLLRRRAEEMIGSAGYVLRERLATAGGASGANEPTLREAGGARGWQTLYNFACFYAVRSSGAGVDDRRRAVELLERLLFEMDAGGQLTQQWVDRDPDLDNLRTDPRFGSFRLHLPEEPSPDDRREQ